jgi:hypothetical protein
VVVTTELVLPRSDLFKTEHYNDFLRPAQVDSGVAVTIQKDSSRYFSVNVLFPQATAERDSDAVGRLQRLVPHMLRVTQLNRQLAGLETRALAAETVLDGLVTAMMVVNAAGHVVYLNVAAERIVTAADGLTISRFVLDAVRPGEGKLLRQLVASAVQVPRNATASPGGVMRISRRSGCSPYEVLVAPLSDPQAWLRWSPCGGVRARPRSARCYADRPAPVPLCAHGRGGTAHASSAGW